MHTCTNATLPATGEAPFGWARNREQADTLPEEATGKTSKDAQSSQTFNSQQGQASEVRTEEGRLHRNESSCGMGVSIDFS